MNMMQNTWLLRSHSHKFPSCISCSIRIEIVRRNTHQNMTKLYIHTESTHPLAMSLSLSVCMSLSLRSLSARDFNDHISVRIYEYAVFREQHLKLISCARAHSFRIAFDAISPENSSVSADSKCFFFFLFFSATSLFRCFIMFLFKSYILLNKLFTSFTMEKKWTFCYTKLILIKKNHSGDKNNREKLLLWKRLACTSAACAFANLLNSYR